MTYKWLRFGEGGVGRVSLSDLSGGRCSRYEREGRRYGQCSHCRHQTTVISGTIFEATKRPLTIWFLAMPLLTQSKNNVPALELKHHLGRGSYPTVWAVKHKLMQVMGNRDEGLVLTGRVEIDDASLGGERAGTPGRGSENQVPFVAAVQTTADGKPQKVCFKAVRFTKAEIQDWARRVLAPEAEVYSDALPSMKAGLAAEVLNSPAIPTGSGRKAVLHPEFRGLKTPQITPKRTNASPSNRAASACLRRPDSQPSCASSNLIFRLSCSNSVRFISIPPGNLHDATGQITCYYFGQITCSLQSARRPLPEKPSCVKIDEQLE